jgi:hypothetical protein
MMMTTGATQGPIAPCLRAWLVEYLRTNMTLKNISSEVEALLNFLKTTDVLPSARANMAHRIRTNLGPHGTASQWQAFVDEARKKEPHLYSPAPYSPDARAATLRGMNGAGKLEVANLHGGNK